MDYKICANCGFLGDPKTVVKGGCLTELVLWCLFIIPGLIYSIWRLSSKHKACPKCGAQNMIPVDTPVGEKLVAQYNITIPKSRYPTINKG
ncbi:MAG: hypothetical protein RBS49_10830 [Sphaerochaeta sp.]|jgi:ribosomal protein S27AE|nr:hypothetical protein [Sphaerochaeta sp.]